MDQARFRHLIPGDDSRSAAGTRWRRILCAACVAVLPASGLDAQERPPDQPPRIGLVLSGGAAKGFAHIGVLRVLEEAGVPIDLITGTSMGALVGGLHASGYDASRLESLAREIDWARLFRDSPERSQLFPDRRGDAARTAITLPFSSGRPQLPAGVVGGKNIHRLISRLTWPVGAIEEFSDLPIPFAAIATDLETGAPVRLERGVLADALRATMSIPGAFEPVVLDGRLLIDGGLIRNLPARDALDLGADILICSDVSEPLARAENIVSAFDVLLQTVSFRMNASTEEQRRLCDVLIRPEIGGLSGFSFDNAADWIDRGDRAARIEMARLRALATASAGAGLASPAPARLTDPLRMGRVEVRGVEGEPLELARRTLALEPGPVTADEVDRAIGRLYSTELFERASYHVAIEGADTALIVDVASAAMDEIGFGFRYDDRYKASLLFTATLHNLLDYGSLTRLELRLGEQLLLDGRHSWGRGLSTPFTITGAVTLARVPLDVYAEGSRVAEIRTSFARTRLMLGSTIGRSAVGGIHGGVEWSRDETAIAPTDSSRRQSLSTVGALYRMDTLDRTAFPTRGVSLRVRAEWGVPVIGDSGFQSHFADLSAVLPLASPLSLTVRGYAGVARGNVPYRRLFFLGGVTAPGVLAETQPTFPGLAPQERSGRAIQMAAVRLQWEPRPNLFLTASANAGATADQWSRDLRDYSQGWAISLGSLTIAGPVEVTVAGLKRGGATIHIDIGHNF